MKIIFLSIAIILSILNSCKSTQKQHTVNNNTANKQTNLQKQLQGNWQWIKTNCCGRLNTITTPESTEQNISYTFEKTGVLIKNVNGNSETTTYSIGNSFNAEKDTMLQLGNMPRPAYIHFKVDTLIIDYGYIDLQTEWYIKAKNK